MKSERTTERNNTITNYLNDLYNKAINDNYNIPDNINSLLNDVFNSTASISFREIVLVALVGKKLDDNFSAYNDFYGCKPRGICEGPIKDFFLKKRFPHTKSGPLNIAKASNINDEWAKKRKCPEDAHKVVSLIQIIDGDDDNLRENIGLGLMKLYLKITVRLDNLKVKISPSTDPVFLSSLCNSMINNATDLGNTPQRIFGYLLETYHESFETSIHVSGTEDSASATSTTSKKPGDINEESADGTILKVYEITVKKFDLSRMKDSYDCVDIYNKEHGTNIKEIIVVCRKQDCIPDMQKTNFNFCMGVYEYQDIIYYYWDIYEWIIYTLEHMIPSAREIFYKKLNDYVNDQNTHEKVKLHWKNIHEEIQSTSD